MNITINDDQATITLTAWKLIAKTPTDDVFNKIRITDEEGTVIVLSGTPQHILDFADHLQRQASTMLDTAGLALLKDRLACDHDNTETDWVGANHTVPVMVCKDCGLKWE